MADWNSVQYLKFAKERTQPAIDLANKIPLEDPQMAIDIGCGPGNSTRVLADRFPHARVMGVDNSPNMIGKAKKMQTDLEFRLFDASKDFDTMDQTFDIVFSNACIQWVPDHPVLLRNMMGLLREGGVLAVQVPMNFQEPVHRILEELSTSEKWKSHFSHVRTFYTLEQREYFDLLAEISSDFSIWETIYCHRMPSHESIIEWYKSTGLRPYLAALSERDATEFERDVYHEVVKAYPKQKNGEIIFRFPRFFFTAVKA